MTIIDFIISILPLFVTFFITYYLIKKWIPIAHREGYIGKDMNKYNKPEVAEIGGLYAIIGIIFGILLYIALKVYIYHTQSDLIQVFAILTLLSLTTLLGLFDDILGWKKGLKHYIRVLLTFILALPLMIIAAGYNYSIYLPFIGTLYLGILYPLLIVPIAIMGTSNAFNMIAGYNGLEAIMGIILFFDIGLKSLLINQIYISYISLLVIIGLLSFLIYNFYPAKVFPGNSFEYGIGALWGALIILGNMELFGLIIFIPYFIELLLFIRGLRNGVYKENFGIPDENNYLNEPYNKIYSLTHFAIKLNKKLFGKATEKSVVYTIAIIEIIFSIIAFII